MINHIPGFVLKKESFPEVFQTRNVVKDGSEYFGPYMSTYVVNVLLDFFSELFYDNGFDPDSYINRNLKEKNQRKIQQGNFRNKTSS